MMNRNDLLVPLLLVAILSWGLLAGPTASITSFQVQRYCGMAEDDATVSVQDERITVNGTITTSKKHFKVQRIDQTIISRLNGTIIIKLDDTQDYPDVGEYCGEELENGTYREQHHASYTATIDVSDFENNVSVRVLHNGEEVASNGGD